ncbi:DUF397 domain-containing protein [Actinophytocola algeriensis]|uniref:DUF397 domain-containing protein n=1 Tax=Actinophytocola algeriensis TaxID=1768010 RepID=A0A7W7Q4T5_9PSEU|nr:DUF397 domain-containing protein [Actinophytocola algeriensis]MBB4907075.1 hypothetical protein [Actinophytocola algeriensis]MBE1478558.1 hypothetical protein [Actinophytocola algeriensis]
MQSPAPMPDNAQWRKSTRSDQGENCVELWRSSDQAAVRDSKNAAGSALNLPTSALDSLLEIVTK